MSQVFRIFANILTSESLLKHWRLLNVFTSFNTFPKLINSVENTRIEIFTDIRIPSNNARKKGKERKRLTCDKVKYTVHNQFEV